MSNIQQARDVLKKWRADATRGAWDLSWDWSTFMSTQSNEDNGYIGDTVRPQDARLIVGTAGNPELLNAIDDMLGYALFLAPVEGVDVDGLTQHAQRIAAAIAAADERMRA